MSQRTSKPLFADSKLTDEERRKIRADLRKVKHDLSHGEITPSKARDINNVLNEKVCYTRESVLDVENVGLVATVWGKELEKAFKVQRYDATKLAQKLASKCSNQNGTFNWKSLGVESGVCFNSVPSGVSFLAGALDQSVVTKKKVVKKAQAGKTTKEAEVKETRPDQLEAKGKQNGDELSAMDRLYKKMKRKIQKTDEALREDPSIEDCRMDGIEFLVNPKSFTQTVENIFTYGFLVKQGLTRTAIAEDGDWKLEFQTADVPEKWPPYSQAVCSFTMADWRRFCAERSQEPCAMGHRSGKREADMEED